MSSQLKTSVILKRKIHKIYDLMKCQGLESFAHSILGKYIYFVLKENMFSLQDLSIIYEGSLIPKMKEFFSLLEKHLLECQVFN